jgi:diadenosine tetraphosphate (Ap4A) HIT family hydrolase
MEYGQTGSHGKRVTRPVEEVNRGEHVSVIMQIQPTKEPHVLVTTMKIKRVIPTHAQVSVTSNSAHYQKKMSSVLTYIP